MAVCPGTVGRSGLAGQDEMVRQRPGETVRRGGADRGSGMVWRSGRFGGADGIPGHASLQERGGSKINEAEHFSGFVLFLQSGNRAYLGAA